MRSLIVVLPAGISEIAVRILLLEVVHEFFERGIYRIGVESNDYHQRKRNNNADYAEDESRQRHAVQLARLLGVDYRKHYCYDTERRAHGGNGAAAAKSDCRENAEDERCNGKSATGLFSVIRKRVGSIAARCILLCGIRSILGSVVLSACLTVEIGFVIH